MDVISRPTLNTLLQNTDVPLHEHITTYLLVCCSQLALRSKLAVCCDNILKICFVLRNPGSQCLSPRFILDHRWTPWMCLAPGFSCHVVPLQTFRMGIQVWEQPCVLQHAGDVVDRSVRLLKWGRRPVMARCYLMASGASRCRSDSFSRFMWPGHHSSTSALCFG